MVESDEAGRRGVITTFWEQRESEPVVAQMLVHFDLDADLRQAATPTDAFVLESGTHPLAPHLLLCFRREWSPYFARQPEAAVLAAAASIAANLVSGLQMLFTFAGLLAERAVLREHTIDLSRLNHHRARKGAAALLDHVEFGSISHETPSATCA